MVNPGKKLKKKSIIWARIYVKFTPLSPRILSVQSLSEKTAYFYSVQVHLLAFIHEVPNQWSLPSRCSCLVPRKQAGKKGLKALKLEDNEAADGRGSATETLWLIAGQLDAGVTDRQVRPEL